MKKLSNGRHTPYRVVYDLIRDGLITGRWYAITQVDGRSLTRADVNKMRSTITHNAKRGVYGAYRIETEQGTDYRADEQGIYTFKVRKVRKETA